MAGYEGGAFTDSQNAARLSKPAPSIRESIAAAEARLEVASAKYDKVMANPNVSDSAYNKALTNWLKESNAVNNLYGQLANSSGGSSSPSGYSDPGSGSSSSGNSSPLNTALLDSPTPTPPTPPTPPIVPEVKVVIPVKTAPIDTLLIDQDTISPDLMTDLIFENIGGQELINIARNDTINGQTVSYQPIKNLTSIQQQYNPNNIVSLQNTSDKYFINFPIKLETHLLEEGEGGGPSGAYVYVEAATGDLIVELVNLQDDQQLEVQISQSGTIYEAEFNES